MCCWFGHGQTRFIRTTKVNITFLYPFYYNTVKSLSQADNTGRGASEKDLWGAVMPLPNIWSEWNEINYLKITVKKICSISFEMLFLKRRGTVFFYFCRCIWSPLDVRLIGEIYDRVLFCIDGRFIIHVYIYIYIKTSKHFEAFVCS